MRLTTVPALIGLAVAASLAGAALAEPRFSFDSTPGRLPKDVVPAHYALRIVPDMARERFEGRVEIDLDVRKPVDALVLNAANLDLRSARLVSAGTASNLSIEVDAARETVRLAPASGPVSPGSHRLLIDYAAPIAKHSLGFFQIPYKAQENGRLVEKKMLATHFEPVHARKMFPSWDEPAFRATFDISVVIEEPLVAVSNMPVARTTPLADGRKEIVFARSVSMPTYLVALCIGELEGLHDEVDGIRLGIYAVKGKSEQGRFAMQATKQIVRWFNDYFGERYPLPKLDQIALPGGFGGAMENWGAIVYVESRLLDNPATSTLRLRQSIYGIVAHEIAHQWFGNLVTMAWWDNLWLNEAFATWMATKTAERFYAQWQTRLRTALWVDEAMMEDARRSTHPVQTPVEDDARAMDVFDSITYNKGAAFVHMLEGFVGEEAFRDGVRRYMRAHRLSNTTSADLWHHLGEASAKDVRAFAASWIEQPGLPLVRIEQRCSGTRNTVRLAQERFTLQDPRAMPLTWKIPVTIADNHTGEHRLLLEAASTELQRDGCSVARVTKAGYYRVQYDTREFESLAAGLQQLPPPDRLRLLTDTFALVLAGRDESTRYLRLAERLGGDTDRTIWEQVVDSMRLLRELIDRTEDRAAFDRYVARLLAQPFARIGWDARAGEEDEIPALRRVLIDALGRLGDAAVVREAHVRFEARKERPIDASIRPAVLAVVGRHADSAAFDALLAEMRSATDVESKWQAQAALRKVAEPKLQLRWMELLLSDELPPGDAVYNLMHTGTESERPEPVWQFVRKHLAAVYAKSSPHGRAYVLPETATSFAEAARAEELLELTRANLDPSAMYQAEKIADLIRLKAEVKAREAARVVQWVTRERGR